MEELEGFFKALPSIALFAFLIVVVAFIVDTFYPLFIAGGVAGIAYAGYRVYENNPAVMERRLRNSAHELYKSLRHPDLPSQEEFEGTMLDTFKRVGDNYPTFEISTRMMDIGRALYEREGFGEALQPPPEHASALEYARYKDTLSKHAVKMARPNVVRQAAETLARSLRAFCDELPPFAQRTEEEMLEELRGIKNDEGTSHFSIGLLESINANQAVQSLILPFYTDTDETAPFQTLRETFDRNYEKQKSVMPLESESSGAGS